MFVYATVAERLASHRRIFDIYGYCGLSILSEYFYHGDIQQWTVATKAELDMAAEILSPAQKIVLGLEMAQGLQLLHDHETARIVHGDVQMGQFLLNENMTMLKLNDFNRAEFQLWDATARDYCRHRNGRGGGTWRAPEEYRDDPLTEKVDVWSLGNNLYVLLTGTGLQFGRHRGMPNFKK